ncbi:MAG: hypothetical protein J7513_09125, partial [Solirubrobacteraceae bacterium]|nr:hypothetical protein [Solirubrobacteraceae bacterium]
MSSTRTTYATLVAVVLTAATAVLCWMTGALATAAGNVSWSNGTDLPFRAHEAGGIGADGKVFVFGGYDVEYIGQTGNWRPRSRATSYDPATGTWTELAALPAFAAGSAAGATHIGTATDDSRYVYLAGGYPANKNGTGQLFGSKTVLRYDIANDRYDALPDLPFARGAGGLGLIGRELHFVGGSDNARETVSDHWALDLDNLAAGWKPRAALPSPRNHLATAVVHGRLFVAGGQVGENAAATTSDSLEAYNPATDKWNDEPSLPTALSHLGLATNGDVLYLLGGETAFTKPGTFAYTFNPATETWGPLTALPDKRSTGVAAFIDGVLYYAGGGRSKILYRGSTTGAPLPTPVPTATPVPGSTPTPTPKPGTTPKPNPTATPLPAKPTPEKLSEYE